MLDAVTVLVDENDREVGAGPIDEIRRDGGLHRSFAVFVVNPDGLVAINKRPFGDLWEGYLCASLSGLAIPTLKPRAQVQAAVDEAFGPDNRLSFLFKTRYRAVRSREETERAICHTYLIHAASANESTALMAPDAIDQALRFDADLYTPLFRVLWPKVARRLREN